MITIGIDEVGRGPIAGPVTLCALALKRPLPKKILKTFRDSKKLSPSQRDEWFLLINDLRDKGILEYKVASVSAKVIDRIGIAVAIKRALARALNSLNIHPTECSVLLDGSLKAPLEYFDQKTIIKGDESEPAIALASIAAKVIRDRYMTRQDRKYPGYGFKQHKGYGTRAHYDGISKNGLSELHRRSFLRTCL